MSDEGDGFDPCECVWGHELAMRRLLNVLRNSQALCTDSECYVDDATPRQSSQPDQVLLMSIIFITALLLYYFRPRSETSSKPSTSGNNPRNPPPATN
ncbi:small integral membrane protein 14 [Anoplophora glabripennis]|uniref:small integral membrane protein 14 n=1 Tax=Anoplophora glabripennis TaxID=217634 RepID=UPI0008736710|nr:small integral membrane protein 14 [Anoplophora glabripennis]